MSSVILQRLCVCQPRNLYPTPPPEKVIDLTTFPPTYTRVKGQQPPPPQQGKVIDLTTSPCDCAKKVVLNFQWPIAPPKCFTLGNK